MGREPISSAAKLRDSVFFLLGMVVAGVISGAYDGTWNFITLGIVVFAAISLTLAFRVIQERRHNR
jgi:fatty acid desaturase